MKEYKHHLDINLVDQNNQTCLTVAINEKS